jgi:hypothetical protein
VPNKRGEEGKQGKQGNMQEVVQDEAARSMDFICELWMNMIVAVSPSLPVRKPTSGEIRFQYE